MQTFRDQAIADINANVHKKGTIEILDDDKFYYKFLFLETHVSKNNETIIKLVELSDTEFSEDNKVYRFSLEELIIARSYFLIREEKKQEKFNLQFPNLSKV